jgi:hypothetical protein
MESMPGGDALLPRIAEVEARVAEVAGVIHGGFAALVDLAGTALDEKLWQGWGIHSPAQWLAWKSGLSIRVAGQVVKVARRREDLPCAFAALRSGELSLDQVRLLARHVPGPYDESATALAKQMTVAQLERVLPRYAWGDDTPDDPPDPEPEPKPEPKPASDPTSESEKEKQDPDRERRGSFWFDEHGRGRLSAVLAGDEALLLDAALKAARAELLARHRAECPDEPVPWFGHADALVELARSYMARGAVEHPGRDRFVVHAHLEQHPDGTPVVRSHLGPVLPDVLRRFLTCDCDVRPVWEVHGTALSVGRTERLVPDRARRIIEQRDGGCIVPGCGRTVGLDVHHIVHWEHGGRTDTSNLCCLCRKHHRQHHLGLLGISGDADRPGELVVTDRWGRPMHTSGVIPPAEPKAPPERTAATREVPVVTYKPATGERCNARDIWLQPRATRAGPAA